MHVWLNGQLVDADKATLPIDDHGLVVGDGAFETIKTSGGRAFAVTRHLARLRRTLQALAIAMPDEDLLSTAIADTVTAGGHLESRIRLTVTAGSGSLGSGMPHGAPSVVVAVTELKPQVAPIAITVPWTRNERGATAGLKTTSYAENVRALRIAHEAGASEAILANTRDELCEGTGTNVFVVIQGETFTPPLSSGCLAGVSRELLLEATGTTIAERSMPFNILTTADEIFLTSTTRDVQGLTRIDDRSLSVGPVTQQLATAFEEILRTIDP
ncbi:MAG: aminotransferase class IV [Acidimicrobiales bacterium]